MEFWFVFEEILLLFGVYLYRRDFGDVLFNGIDRGRVGVFVLWFGQSIDSIFRWTGMIG